jgi:hypothetical protein
MAVGYVGSRSYAKLAKMISTGERRIHRIQVFWQEQVAQAPRLCDGQPVQPTGLKKIRVSGDSRFLRAALVPITQAGAPVPLVLSPPQTSCNFGYEPLALGIHLCHHSVMGSKDAPKREKKKPKKDKSKITREDVN